MSESATILVSRRAETIRAIQAETGIDEMMIENVVRGFYQRVRQDDLLGPVFESRIADWDSHLERMFAFWSSVALMSGRYHGQPMPKHLPLPVDGIHFDRWLALFEATVGDLCPPRAARHFLERARRIAESMELGVAGANGVMLLEGERLHRPELHAPDTDAPRSRD